jgi:hypothetical protein
LYIAIKIYGENILSTEGELWRRYKKLTAPAFHDVRVCALLTRLGFLIRLEPFQRNNKLVWVESVRVVGELFDQIWQDEKEIDVDHCLDLTLPVSLPTLSSPS